VGDSLLISPRWHYVMEAGSRKMGIPGDDFWIRTRIQMETYRWPEPVIEKSGFEVLWGIASYFLWLQTL